MSPRSRRIATVLGVLIACVILPAAARATYLTPVPLSGAGDVQFLEASFPTLSADDQWVAFQGVLGDQAGVWRRNLATGAVQLVAGGSSSSFPPQFENETAPSISANGQFIAFTTTQNLDGSALPASDEGCPEVYVANMDPSDGSDQPTYTLAATQQVDGASVPIAFAYGCTLTGGAQAAPGVALSADGSEVAFTLDSPSNLGFPTDSPTSCSFSPADPGAPPADQTCGGQVVVSNLATGTTTPVSVTPSGQPTPWGGAYPSVASLQDGIAQASTATNNFAEVQPISSAAISADGTTVAWLGTNVPSQVPAAQQAAVTAEIVNGMSAQVTSSSDLYDNEPDLASEEVEPLWRRIGDGGSASTVRLLANAGLNFYAFTGVSAFDQGSNVAPAISGGSLQATGLGTYASAPGETTSTVYPPALSADGEQVAVTSGAPPTGELPTLAALEADETGTPNPLPSDLYLVDVSDGSGPQVTPLTDISSYAEGPEESASVTGQPAISPDGSMIAFDTERTSFSTLSSPLLITPPFAYAGYAQTLVVDTATDTLQLATSTYNGSTPDGDSAEPSVDDAGNVAVEATANNLFYGQTVAQGLGIYSTEQVYLLGAVPQSTAVATESLSPPLGGASPTVSWTISAASAQRRDGAVLVQVAVPGAGEVSATAAAQLVQTARDASRARIPFRTVGSARAAARGGAVVSCVVRLDRADRRYAESRHGLYARMRVTFTAAGHAPVTETIPATFHVRHAVGHRRHTTSTSHHRGHAR